MSSDIIISVEHLSKRYKLGQIGATSLRESAEERSEPPASLEALRHGEEAEARESRHPATAGCRVSRAFPRKRNRRLGVLLLENRPSELEIGAHG